jgi:hypothetical protein
VGRAFTSFDDDRATASTAILKAEAAGTTALYDGRRRVSVRVRGAGLVARTRAGYLAPRGPM